MGFDQMQAVRSGVNNRYKRLFIEGSWVTAGQLMRALGVLIGIRLLTGCVPPAVYGTFSLLSGVVGLGTSVFCTPFLGAALRFFQEIEPSGGLTTLRTEIRRLLFPSTAVLAVVIMVAGGILVLRQHPTALTTTLFMAVLLCASTLSAYETSFLTAARKQRRFSIWVAAEAWLKPLLAVVLVFMWQASVNAILIGHIAGTIIMLIFFFRPPEGLKAGFLIDLANSDRQLRRRIISFAMPLLPLPILGWLSSAGDRYIIGGLLDLEAVGSYAAAYGIVFHPFVVFSNIIETTVRPIYYKMASDKDTKRLKRAFRLWLGTTSIICAVGVAAVFILHERIADLLLGAQFRHASSLMPWIAMGGALLSITQVLQKPFFANMQTRNLLYIELCGAIAALLFTVVMIAALGLKGAAMAVPMYYGVQCSAAWALNLRARAKERGKGEYRAVK